MLGTIRVPKNLRLLSERLPKSNYVRKKKENKHDDGKSSSSYSSSLAVTE